MPRPPSPTLFPYTTLFRSVCARDLDPKFGHFIGGLGAVLNSLGRVARILGILSRIIVSVAHRQHGAGRKRQWRLQSIIALPRSEEHTSELQSHVNLVCRLL